MSIWHGFIDESYNSKTFCVGGFFAPEEVWTELESDWLARIGYENRKSALKGWPPISRYHATDCAGLHKDFNKKNGWDGERQIRFTKALCAVLRKHKPNGLVVGGSYEDVRPYLDPNQDEKRFMYSLSFKMMAYLTTTFLQEISVGDKVKLYYDQSKNFASLAREATDQFFSEPPTEYLREYFAGSEARSWQECPALQPADYMTYEGMKRINGALEGRDAIRRSLQSLLGQIPISVAHFKSENYADILRMHANVQAGRPISEGVTSGLVVCAGD